MLVARNHFIPHSDLPALGEHIFKLMYSYETTVVGLLQPTSCLECIIIIIIIIIIITTTTTTIIIIIIKIINLIYIAQFDTNGILTALYIVITYIQMQYVHV